MEKYEVDGNCLIIFGNCHDINGNKSSSSNNGTDNYDPFENEMEMTTKQRSQANARERFRTHRFIESFSSSLTTSIATKKLNQELKNFSHHSVNSAFNTLRLLIPTEPKNRKLSKIETLRLAKSYISHLNATLATGNASCRQPCFGASTLHKQRQHHQHQEQHDYRSNICTFCVSSVIHQKRIN